jgi:hypothetical protein
LVAIISHYSKLKSRTMAQKTTPVRLSDEAIKWARIASGYTGESMAEYVSRIVEERGREDADRLHAELSAAPSKPPRKAKQGSGSTV